MSRTFSLKLPTRRSLLRYGMRLADNWRRGYAAHLQLRREYMADGEWSLWATSYVLAPLFWLLVAVFSIYATSKGQFGSHAEVGDGGPLTHESKHARTRRALH